MKIKTTPEHLEVMRLHFESALKAIQNCNSEGEIEINIEGGEPLLQNDKLDMMCQYGETDPMHIVAEAIDTLFVIKNILASGGRVLLLTSDSDIPQEITFQQEV